MICDFLEVLNFDQLFFKLKRFIYNQQPIISVHCICSSTYRVDYSNEQLTPSQLLIGVINFMCSRMKKVKCYYGSRLGTQLFAFAIEQRVNVQSTTIATIYCPQLQWTKGSNSQKKNLTTTQLLIAKTTANVGVDFVMTL